MFEPIVICGFPGIGKSTYASNRKDVEDLESSAFSWILDPFNPEKTRVRNQEFPINYISCIKSMLETRKNHETRFILVACHKEVREELKRVGIPYLIVAPFKDMESKNEYLRRYLSRGSDIQFIENLNKNWEKWLDELEEDGAPVIHMQAYNVLSDLLRD